MLDPFPEGDGNDVPLRARFRAAHWGLGLQVTIRNRCVRKGRNISAIVIQPNDDSRKSAVPRPWPPPSSNSTFPIDAYPSPHSSSRETSKRPTNRTPRDELSVLSSPCNAIVMISFVRTTTVRLDGVK